MTLRLIDAHLHVMDREWIPGGVRTAWARQAMGRRFPERRLEDLEPKVMTKQSDPTAGLTVAAFDKCGVAGGMVPSVDWTLATPRQAGDLTVDEMLWHYDRLFKETNHRLAYCAGIDPRHPDARERAERMTKVEGCVGFKLYPAAGWSMDDPAHGWLPGFCEEREVPMVIHTAAMGGDPLVTPNSRPSALVGQMAKHPNATWVFAHAGFEAWWLEAIDLAWGWRSAYLEISLWQMCADRDYDEFRNRMKVMVQKLGTHRVIFGSDIIRGPGEDEDGSRLQRWIDQVVGLSESWNGGPPIVDEDDLRLIMADNASRVYGLDKWF
ncbi:MAG: amidohydrolase family protein [Ilumatobacteraceae bacterium]